MTGRLALAIGITMLLSAGLAAPAHATRVANCHYVEDGAAGPEGNYLHVSVLSERRVVRIVRDGDAIELSTARTAAALPSSGSAAVATAVASRRPPELAASTGVERELRCTGTVPTVLNLDRISIVVAEDLDDAVLELNLAGGSFEPGATDEGDGSSEIEVALRSLNEGLLGSGLAVSGGPGADLINLGLVGRQPGMNLNAGEATADVDVTTTLGSLLLVNGAGGDDTISAGGGPGFTRPSISFVGFLRGGAGNDTLSTGLAFFSIAFGSIGDDVLKGRGGIDFLLGGAGRDRLTGRGFIDFLWAGRGRDELRAGRGADVVLAKDRSRDLVLCGGGLDSARFNRVDRTIGCEHGPFPASVFG